MIECPPGLSICSVNYSVPVTTLNSGNDYLCNVMTEAEYDKKFDSIAGERAKIPAETPDPLITETSYGLTPNGGDYSVAYYFDGDGNPCPKQNAKSVNIVEYSGDGRRINETYLVY